MNTCASPPSFTNTLHFRSLSPSPNPNFIFSAQSTPPSITRRSILPPFLAAAPPPPPPIPPVLKLRHGTPLLLAGKPRVSSGDSDFLGGGERMEASSFVEFLTSERVKVVMMLALALALCNADRVVMSVAIVPLSLSHGWSRAFAGVVQSSFLWGYLISPIAGGALVDYCGGKAVMGWGVALWSFATFLTPWAAEKSLWALLVMRALLGIAEGVALPSMNYMISKWFPQAERARAVGIAMAGFQLGSAIGLVLSPILMSNAGVFGPFVIFGLFGFLWVVVWLSATSSIPERSPQISTYELNYILTKRQQSPPSNVGKIHKAKVIPPFKRLLSRLPTWSLMVANAMHSWGFFVILSWMPLYFNSVYHVDLRQAAWFSAVPWSMMALVGYFGGAWSDMLIQRGFSITMTRRTMQSIGFFGPGIALIGLTTATSPSIASAWLTLAVGLKSFSHSGFLVNIQEIAPQYTGILHGLANTAGTFAAILGTVGAGYFVELFGSFRGFLWLTSFLYFLAALFWNLFSTGELVDFDASSIFCMVHMKPTIEIAGPQKKKNAAEWIFAIIICFCFLQSVLEPDSVVAGRLRRLHAHLVQCSLQSRDMMTDLQEWTNAQLSELRMKKSPLSSSNRSHQQDISGLNSPHDYAGMMQNQEKKSRLYQFIRKITISCTAFGSKSEGAAAPELDQSYGNSNQTDLSYGNKNSNQIHSNYSGLSSGSKNRQPNSFNSADSASGEVYGSLNFTLQDIKKATKNFSQSNVIGDGGFGTVYKGQLKDGTVVAIKRAKKDLYDKRSAQEFKSEVQAYSKIEHLNLVKFYGYLEHPDEKIIVVEYVGNGTLFDLLHGNRGLVLEITERLDIAIDVAHAITYLHSYNDPPIIHRDIKASNILITEKFRAKVADFGLARFVPDGADVTHISTQIKGTAGYLDPEYMKSYQLTEKSDVYSFGVVLVELVTGRHPIEPFKGVKERVTTRWAMNKLREGMPVLAMDPRLNRSPASIKVVENMLELTKKCTGPVRQSRPSMKECVETLWTIRKELKEGTQLNYSASHRSVDILEKDARKIRQESLGIEGESYSFMSA